MGLTAIVIRNFVSISMFLCWISCAHPLQNFEFCRVSEKYMNAEFEFHRVSQNSTNAGLSRVSENPKDTSFGKSRKSQYLCPTVVNAFSTEGG